MWGFWEAWWWMTDENACRVYNLLYLMSAAWRRSVHRFRKASSGWTISSNARSLCHVFFRAAKQTASRRFVPRASRSGSQFTSAQSISCRVVFLHDVLEGIRRQSSEDTAARAVKAKLCFRPFQMETFSIWGGRFSRFRPLDTENGQGSCPKVCSCQSLKLLPQTFNFDLGTELAAPTEMLQFHWMLKNESTFGAKFPNTQESKSLHLRANYHLASRSEVAAG